MYTDLNIDIEAINDLRDQKLLKSRTCLEDALYLIDYIDDTTIKNKLKININFIVDNLKCLYDDITKDLSSINLIEEENTRILNGASQWFNNINLSLNKLNKINISKLRSNLNLSLNSLNNLNLVGNIGSFNQLNGLNILGNFASLNSLSKTNTTILSNVAMQINAPNISSFNTAINSKLTNLQLDSNIKNIKEFESLSSIAINSLSNLDSINLNTKFNNINNISNINTTNLNITSIEQLESILSNNWNSSNINSINYIGNLYENGSINREQFNACILVNSLGDNQWLDIQNNSSNFSKAEFKLMNQLRGISSESIENNNSNSSLNYLTSLFNENNQGSFNGIQLKLGEQLLGVNTADSKFTSAILSSGEFSGFGINSSELNLNTIGSRAVSNNPYSSVILSTLLGIYISAFAIILLQDAKERKDNKKKKNKSEN